MKHADELEYPLVYPEAVIQNAILYTAIKLACWLSNKKASNVLIVPVIQTGKFLPTELFFTSGLLSKLKRTYDILPIKSDGSIPEQYREEYSRIKEFKTDIVILDVVCASGHTLNAISDYFHKPSVDILTVVLLDKQVSGRSFHPDISAIQDSRFAWWSGCGLEDVEGFVDKSPHLVGRPPCCIQDDITSKS